MLPAGSLPWRLCCYQELARQTDCDEDESSTRALISAMRAMR